MASAVSPGAPERAPAPAVRFATVNVRAVSDRWAERRCLLRAGLQELDADVIALQEVLTGTYGQCVAQSS